MPMAFGDLCGFSFFRYDFGATKGSGVNIVQEMTGGAVFQQSLDCLAKFGRMVVYGFAGRAKASWLYCLEKIFEALFKQGEIEL